MEIVLQGKLDDFAIYVAEKYTKCDFVNRVIISCWESDLNIISKNPKITILRNKDIENPGIHNRNRQITTTKNGLGLVRDDVCAKMRTDQEVLIDSMYDMYDFFKKFKQPEVKFENGESPWGKIFVASMFKAYPFHPRDHIFWGYTKDIRNLFEIPLCIKPPHVNLDDGQYVNHIRTETYISQYYFAKFNSKINSFIEQPEKYLVDKAPNIEESMKIYQILRDKIFKTFPPIYMNWPKIGGFYVYHDNVHGEYWHDKEWRNIIYG